MDHGHLLHSVLTCSLDGNTCHLKSRHQFALAAQLFIRSSDNNNRSAVIWVDHQWNGESTTRLHTFITSTHPRGMTLLRIAWIWHNCLCTSVRRFRSCLHKWGVAPFTPSECGAEEPTADYLVLCILSNSP